jgi:hypothetical protein
MRFSKAVLTLLLVVAFGMTAAWGQSTNTGTVVGVVTDQTGAVMPAATVTLTDTITHNERATTTNDQGHYVFVNVPPSKYDISASKSGFSVAKILNDVVNVGTQTTANLQLQVGQTTQIVEVQSTGSELQTLNATVGNVVTSIALTSLPSLGRDVSTFATLQPGVSPDGAVGGTVVDNSSFQLDGGNNTNDMDGSMSVYTPTFAGDPTGGIGQGYMATGVMPTPADSVEEFKVNTANQTADFNSSSGAQVQVVTKRGTNSIHGDVYEYYFDNNFNANTWQNNNTGTKLPDYHYNRFGAAAGGPILPWNFLGGKTYLFGNYQGFRWPNSATYETLVPSAAMRQGLLTFGGVQYNVATYDPRGIGMNSLVQQMWTKYEPLPNDLNCTFSSRCDKVNIQGFKGNVALPQTDNFWVFRLDHDFGPKWRFMSSYRYYKLLRASTSQVDIGGFFAGDKLGVPAAVSSRPQQPWYYVAALTTNITSNVTNDFHYSYLRNYWSWNDKEDTPQFSQLGGALEPFGETASALTPYNLNTQSVRTRFWNGHDNMFRDDLTWLKGSHLLQFGGTYQRNYDVHQRSDNGGGINYQPVYQLGTTGGSGISGVPLPVGFSGSSTSWGRDYASILGIVSIAQTAFTRSGPTLTLNPPNTHAFDQSTINFFNVYASDSWRLKPTLTFTYGLGWTVEKPPTEKNGKQIELVDASNNLISVEKYLAAREAAALQGNVYNPNIGFALVGNVNGKPKYPYNPFYGEWSPRIALAWNPQFDSDSLFGRVFGHNNTVIRGGYGRVYGRLNGVDLVLVPLLGTGLIQAVQCIGPTIAGACAGSGGANPTNAFRIGTDGNTAPIPAPSATLPQPDYPGVNAIAAGAGEALDPNFRPNVTDTITFTIQRQLSQRITLELGYIGRKITHEYQPININAVPYMMTKGGQTFAKAYAGIEMGLNCNVSVNACGANVPAGAAAQLAFFNALPKQPFFEAAMNPAYCAGYASCTAAVAANELGNLTAQAVWEMYSDLDNGGFNFARSMMNTPLPGAFGAQGQMTSGVGVNASIGFGNYNAGFFTIKMNDWHGITTQQNFTWSKALGTGAVVQASSQYTADDPFNLKAMYGVQPFDRKFVYNLWVVYEPPYFKGQHGIAGRLLGGWKFAPLFTAGSGEPMQIYTTNGGGESFGEGDSYSGGNFYSNESAVLNGKLNQGTSSLHYNVAASGNGLNIFSDPAAVFNMVRNPILGLDARNGGYGVFRGFPYWNMDLSLQKNFRIAERFSLEFQTVFTNVLNHMQPEDPNGYFTGTGNLDASNPASFGNVAGQINTPRQMEFGLRIKF